MHDTRDLNKNCVVTVLHLVGNKLIVELKRYDIGSTI